MMVMDGTSSSASTLARWYKKANRSQWTRSSAAVSDYFAESAITDSAPAATAMATGRKSNSSYIGACLQK
ncbi:alkaline phosphatase [Bacillus licheniformis]